MFKGLTQPPTADQVIALAGVFQACAQVDALARLGTTDSRDLETAMKALLNQNPQSTLAVYGSTANLLTGFETLERVLSNPKESGNAVLLRYVIGVFYLARKLAGNRPMLKRTGEGIDRATRQAETFSPTHANVVANVADLYQSTISTFNFRIQVNGVAAHLQQQSIANKIRCLLFSAVRSAILWQQVGGSRVQLMLRRDKVVAVARELHREARRTLH